MTQPAIDPGPAGRFEYGTVFTFTRDLTVAFPGSNRRPGVHFLFIEVSAAGYCFTAWDTQRQRRETFMNDAWLVDLTRIIGNVTSAPATDEE